jgi:hypothetical protein
MKNMTFADGKREMPDAKELTARYLRGEINTETYNELRRRMDEYLKSIQAQRFENASNLLSNKIANPAPQLAALTGSTAR